MCKCNEPTSGGTCSKYYLVIKPKVQGKKCKGWKDPLPKTSKIICWNQSDWNGQVLPSCDIIIGSITMVPRGPSANVQIQNKKMGPAPRGLNITATELILFRAHAWWLFFRKLRTVLGNESTMKHQKCSSLLWWQKSFYFWLDRNLLEPLSEWSLLPRMLIVKVNHNGMYH